MNPRWSEFLSMLYNLIKLLFGFFFFFFCNIISNLRLWYLSCGLWFCIRGPVRKIFCGIIITFINLLSFSSSSPEPRRGEPLCSCSCPGWCISLLLSTDFSSVTPQGFSLPDISVKQTGFNLSGLLRWR